MSRVALCRRLGRVGVDFRRRAVLAVYVTVLGVGASAGAGEAGAPPPGPGATAQLSNPDGSFLATTRAPGGAVTPVALGFTGAREHGFDRLDVRLEQAGNRQMLVYGAPGRRAGDPLAGRHRHCRGLPEQPRRQRRGLRRTRLHGRPRVPRPGRGGHPVGGHGPPPDLQRVGDRPAAGAGGPGPAAGDRRDVRLRAARDRPADRARRERLPRSRRHPVPAAPPP